MTNHAQHLIAHLWEKMSDGMPYAECRAAAYSDYPAGPEVWQQVDQHFAVRAAHPNGGSEE